MPAPMEPTSVPGVYRRGNRYAFTYRKRGRQRWGSAATIAEARRLKRQSEADVDRGAHRDHSRLMFGEYARGWIDTYAGRTSRGFREATRDSYRRALEQRLIPYFDHERGLRLTEIEPQDVKALVQWLARQPHPTKSGRLLSRSHINGHVAVARALLADATEEGVLRTNPAAGIRVAVTEGTGTGREQAAVRPQALTIAQLSALLGQLDPRWRTFFAFLTETGLRIGEAIELRWTDVEFGKRPAINVARQFSNGRVSAPKSHYGRRRIPLSPHMARELWTAQAGPGDLVFTTPSGTRVNRHNVSRRILRPAATAAGVPWASLHTFRHTCASILFAPLEQGGGAKNVKAVQEWLGHHDAGFTLRTYVHLLEEGVGDAEFFDGILGQPLADVELEPVVAPELPAIAVGV